MCGVEVVLKLKKGSLPKPGTSNVISILVSLGVSLFMEKDVSGKADAKDASNARINNIDTGYKSQLIDS